MAPKAKDGTNRGRPGFWKRRLVKVYLEEDDYNALSEIVKQRGQKMSEFIRDLIQRIVRRGEEKG